MALNYFKNIIFFTMYNNPLLDPNNCLEYI